MHPRPTALIADDEPLLREALTRQLARVWPELEVTAQARNGREAIDLFEARRPDICFLDVHMPGLSGVDAANHIGRRAHVVFVTAYDHYAVQAFAQGALDYLLKPVEEARLAETVARLKERLRNAAPLPPLRWIRVQVGQTLRLIPVDEVDYLRSEAKYTLVAWRGEDGERGEVVVRVALKDLVAQLDPEQFAQVHRSVVVNLRAISHVTRHDNETAGIHLKGRPEVLPVSRGYLHLFRQM
jgi:DNA-binding LytR/AlgR family response regulator